MTTKQYLLYYYFIKYSYALYNHRCFNMLYLVLETKTVETFILKNI